MATVVSLTLDHSTVRPGQPTNAMVSVNNTGANPIDVTNVQLVVLNTLASGNTSPSLPVTVVNPNPDVRGGGAGATAPRVNAVTVNASSTSFFDFQILAHAPQAPGAANMGLLINPVVTDNTNGQTATYTATPTMSNFGTLTPILTGGSLANATYLLKLTAIGPMGETLPNAESSGQVISGGSVGHITVNFTPFAGATGYRLYYTTGGAGSEANYMQFNQTTSPIDFTTVTGNVAASPPASSSFSNLAVQPLLASQ